MRKPRPADVDMATYMVLVCIVVAVGYGVAGNIDYQTQRSAAVSNARLRAATSEAYAAGYQAGGRAARHFKCTGGVVK